MKIVRASDLQFIPASHEDPKNPGVLKKVLLTYKDLIKGSIQMVNWGKMPKGRSFQPHYHEGMEEIFIITKGTAKIIIDSEEGEVGEESVIVIPVGKVHEMKNIGDIDLEYIVIGNTISQQGKTVTVRG